MKIGIVYPFSTISTPRVEIFDALTNVIYEMAHRLAQQHEVVVYPSWQAGQPIDEVIEGFHVHRIKDTLDKQLAHWKLTRALGFKHFSAGNHPLNLIDHYYYFFAKKVARHASEQGLDIIHVHCVETLVPVLRRHAPGAKIILHCHDHSLADYGSRSVKKMVEQADAVLTCSDYVRNNVLQHYPGMERFFSTFYNGVDQRYLEVKSDPAGTELVSFVGRMAPEKGVDVLLNAFDTIADDWPAARLQLVGPLCMGTRPFVDPHGVDPVLRGILPYMTEHQRYFDQLQERLEHAKHVQYRGAIANADLQAHYGELAAFAFPSLWQEPFGIPVVEAMAAGIPVVATRSGGLPESVDDGVTGILVERGDETGLAEALGSLLDQPELRRRMGEAGRRRVRALFTWDRQIDRLVSFYHDLLMRERHPSAELVH